MTVQEFLQNYGGNECVSIEGYCEEKHYDYPHSVPVPQFRPDSIPAPYRKTNRNTV